MIKDDFENTLILIKKPSFEQTVSVSVPFGWKGRNDRERWKGRIDRAPVSRENCTEFRESAALSAGLQTTLEIWGKFNERREKAKLSKFPWREAGSSGFLSLNRHASSREHSFVSFSFSFFSSFWKGKREYSYVRTRVPETDSFRVGKDCRFK